LSTKELLRLYQEELLPLAQWYQHICAELEKEKRKFTRGDLWLPTSHKDSVLHLLTQTKANRDRLKRLKRKICRSLLYRASVFADLAVDPHTDDVLAVLCAKIGEKLPRKRHKTLSDDRRILIYDLLKSESFDKETLQKKVLAPVHRHTYPSRFSPSE